MIGGKATSPWRGKITLASSPKRATSTPRMRGRSAMSSGRQARVVASRHSSGPISVSSEAGGKRPNTLTSTHGLSRPYFSICSRAHSALTRVARLGSSGSAVISVRCHSRRSLVQARYSGPSRWVGLPACTMWPSTHEASAASAAAITASGMPPDLVEEEQDVVAVQAGQRLAEPRRVGRLRPGAGAHPPGLGPALAEDARLGPFEARR